MLFHEPLFLFVFFPAFYALYLLFGRKEMLRLVLLTTGSILFYFWGEPRFVPLVILSSLLDYVIAQRLSRDPSSHAGKALLAFGIACNVALLIVYKYLGFLVSNLDAGLRAIDLPAVAVPSIALPIGVSFIVFEKITYLVDVARGQSPPAKSITHYLTYVFFFPKLLAGPIIKYHEIEAKFRRLGHVHAEDVISGMLRFMLGLVKKTLVADTVSGVADQIFALPNTQIGFANAWLGIVLFTLQIYFDFSSYSDMAIGLARMLGFSLKENFDMPYISCSITEFWRRWHISLSSWIREYLYIPLGGSRVGPARHYFNLWFCFLVSGLWHGAAWTYVIWGAYNGVFLVLDKLVLLRVLGRMPAVLANAITMLVVMVGWTAFRATSLPQLSAFLAAMTHPGRQGAGVFLPGNVTAALAAGLFVCIAPRLPGYHQVSEWVRGTGWSRFALETGMALLFLLAVSVATTDPFKPFLYFRF